MLGHGRLVLGQCGGGFLQALRGGLEFGDAGGAQHPELLAQCGVFLHRRRVELAVLILHLRRELLGQLLGLMQLFLGQVVELVQSVGRDADLLGGIGERAGQALEIALPFVERLILTRGVVAEERDGAEQRGEGHAAGDGQDHRGGKRLGAAEGDQHSHAEEGGVADQKRPFGQARGVGGEDAHGDARA